MAKQLPSQIQHVAVSFVDGSVAVMQFIVFGHGDALPSGAVPFGPPGYWMRDPTPENIEAEVQKTFTNEGRVGSLMLAVTGWRLIELRDVPADRQYRGAWTDDGKIVTHDMEKAKEIHRGRLRGQRVQAFAELDGKWMRAMAQKDQKAADEIDAQRQKWRDAPADPRIAAAQTVEELKQVVL
jgi:hypothetical protein